VVVVLIHLLLLVVFTNRYILGMFLQRVRKEVFEARTEAFQPSVCIVIPMFNEGESIRHTLASLREQDYPADKLEIMVVDDCSTDDSYLCALRACSGHPNMTVLRNRENVGKRRGIIRAVRQTSAEIVVSVDSDVVVAKDAVRQLVARFVLPEIAAVGGRVNILNRDQNWLTRMQTIKYYFGYEYLKNLERTFRTVMCLSGCLTAYRRKVLIDLEPILENRSVFGVAIKYGEDRFLTRQIVKAGHKTVMTLDAVCFTKAPATLTGYFSQQLRWRRSNLIDYFAGITHVWKLHPAVALHYSCLGAMLVAYPAFIVHALVTGGFWAAAALHVGVVGLFGALYRFETRSWPASERVSAASFLPMAVVMPVTYLMMTPLALFTLDSGSWETRGQGESPRTADMPGDRQVVTEESGMLST
jgi:cellulose synthase/poly-beta-1,6-N-acetylglucosamine synthase-like glycosyltransferase